EPEGPASLSLSVVDEAGNASSLSRAGLLRLDFTPPVVEHAILLREVLREGQTAALQLTVSEGLSSPPHIELVRADGTEPLAMSLGDQLGTTYTYLWQVDADVADGAYEVRLTNLLDVAENEGAAA